MHQRPVSPIVKMFFSRLDHGELAHNCAVYNM